MEGQSRIRNLVMYQLKSLNIIYSNDENPDDNAPVTKDGTCGPKHGGTICGNWKEGGVSVGASRCAYNHDPPIDL